MPIRTIAIDLDDTLNDFTETLQAAPFPYDPAYALAEGVFHDYLGRLRRGVRDEGALLATEYSFFKYKIHQRCYELARARPDGVAFMRWLRDSGWRIVICTHRDLRRANACTRLWLEENKIPYDHLFMAWNKIVFCRAWGIPILVDDDPFNVTHGEPHGVTVYYPLRRHPTPPASGRGRGFESFEDVKQWIAG
jgi:hypothetical protein